MTTLSDPVQFSCPECGAEPGVNIDCATCEATAAKEFGPQSPDDEFPPEDKKGRPDWLSSRRHG